ncbi:MAG: rhamnan synthesis F family protein [Parvibaculum sp.]|uniref:rhamnan synthesis F family protein n=1 Tax=Parvibaculum sp. TaxID=2024848 RepID=UPI00271BB907|nr:rhamnan synthesis F family protein [Parvibaculum sp.]MDO8837297.1 rhamnan synthesis F family protein [Parvibaculum sp.]
MRLSVVQTVRSGRAAVRLTRADDAVLPAGRYLLHASMPATRLNRMLTISVAPEGAGTAREAALDFERAGIRSGGAATALVPVFVREETAALVVAADIAADALAGIDWRLQHKTYAAFYAVLLWRFARRVVARKESLSMMWTAFCRHGLNGVGVALWGDWEAALARSAPASGFTRRALDYPEQVGLAVRPPVLVPSLCLVADFSRGATMPAIDDALLAQMRLAGFSALCLPCGWDGARPLLPAPVQRFLGDAECDFPFFFRRIDRVAASDAEMDGERTFAAAIAPYLDGPRSLGIGAAAGTLLAGTEGEADAAARLPDTPPTRFGRAAHAAIGRALADADGSAAPAIVFVDLARQDDGGSMLAEDRRYGDAWVESLRVAQARHAAAAHKPSHPLRAAIAVHAFYPDVFAEILATLQEVPPAHKLFVTTTADRQAAIERLLAATGRDYALHVFDNRGRDVLPFMNIYGEICAEGFDLVAKVHTKKSTHRRDGEDWRRALVAQIAGRGGFARILAAFERDASLGMTGPDVHLTGFHNNIVVNEARVFGLARRLGLTARDVTHGTFFAGSMFVARVAALAPLMSLAIDAADFEPEAGQLDGTLAHAIERGFALSVVSSGMRVAGVEDVLRRGSILWNMSA